MSSQPTIHTKEDFIAMRRAGQLAASVLDYIDDYVEIGVTTDELNTLCHEYIIANNAIPAPLNYKGFPKSICTSLNYVICHGIPDSRKLKKGNILNIDVTVILDGWYGDTSRMYHVGKIPKSTERLIQTTYDAMYRGIEVVRPGATLGCIGHAIQSFVEPAGYSLVRDYCGHGIGRVFHDAALNVLHYGKPNTGVVLEEGMFFTIEPMVNAGKYRTRLLNDDWTVVTADRSLSAQFEHTIGVTASGFEIFTLSAG